MTKTSDHADRDAHSRAWCRIDLREWGFDFDTEDDTWLEQVRLAEEPRRLGQIGPFELLEEVSRGGQGVVYRARQPHTQRIVALKRLLAGSYATVPVRRRFEREVQAAASLKHPGIVTVYGMEIVEDQPMIAMEWIDGLSATDWAKRQGRGSARRDPAEILELFRRVCDAVTHAHEHGVLHRDLKPSNILVDTASRPHVLDFGLAKRIGDADDLTGSRDLLGTPTFASPEQLNPRGRPLDARSDVFSLGVVLYEMLTDLRPFPESSVADLVQAMESRQPPRPSTHDPRLGRALDVVLRKALAHEPEDRYPSVAEFAEDVRRYLHGEPITAVAPSTWYLLSRLVSRHRLVSFLTLALFLLTGAFAVYAVGQTRELKAQRDSASRAHLDEAEARQVADRQRAQAVRAQADAEHEQAIAEAMSSFLLEDMLIGANPFHGESGLTVRAAADRAAEQVERRFGNQPEVETAVRLTLAEMYLSLNALDRAEAQLAGARSTDTQTIDPRLETLTASLLGARDEFEEALPHLRAAENRLRAMGAQDSIRMADVLGQQASVLQQVGRLDEAEPILRRALDIDERLAWRENYGQRELFGHIRRTVTAGIILATRGRWEEAEHLFDGALGIAAEVASGGPAISSQVLLHRGNARRELGQLEEAEADLRQAWMTQHGIFGDRDATVALLEAGLGQVLMERDQLDEAESRVEGALDVLRTEHDVPPGHVGIALMTLGWLRLRQGRSAEALAAFKEALDFTVRATGEHNDTVGVVHNEIGKLLCLTGNPIEAETHFSAALEIIRGQHGPTSQPAFVVITGLLDSVLLQEKAAPVPDLCEETFAAYRSQPDLDPTQTIRLFFRAAVLLVDRQQGEEAMVVLDHLDELTGGFLEPSHAAVRQILIVRSRALRLLARWTEAEALLMERKAFESEHHREGPSAELLSELSSFNEHRDRADKAQR